MLKKAISFVQMTLMKYRFLTDDVY